MHYFTPFALSIDLRQKKRKHVLLVSGSKQIWCNELEFDGAHPVATSSFIPACVLLEKELGRGGGDLILVIVQGRVLGFSLHAEPLCSDS